MNFFSFSERLLQEDNQEDYYRNLAQRYRDASMQESNPFQKHRLERQAEDAENRANAAASREKARSDLGMDTIQAPSPGIPNYQPASQEDPLDLRMPDNQLVSQSAVQQSPGVASFFGDDSLPPAGSTENNPQNSNVPNNWRSFLLPDHSEREIRKGINIQKIGDEVTVTADENSPYIKTYNKMLNDPKRKEELNDPKRKEELLAKFDKLAPQLVAQHYGVPQDAISVEKPEIMATKDAQGNETAFKIVSKMNISPRYETERSEPSSDTQSSLDISNAGNGYLAFRTKSGGQLDNFMKKYPLHAKNEMKKQISYYFKNRYNTPENYIPELEEAGNGSNRYFLVKIPPNPKDFAKDLGPTSQTTQNQDFSKFVVDAAEEKSPLLDFITPQQYQDLLKSLNIPGSNNLAVPQGKGLPYGKMYA